MLYYILYAYEEKPRVRSVRSLKIVVLAGGLSPERQVSLVSGQSICRALRELGHRAVLVDMFLGLEGQEDIFSGPAGPLEEG